MRMLLSTIGSRGDVQPLVALALQLKALGQEVRLCVPPDCGVVAGVLGVEHALGELRPALVRRGGELHEHGGVLYDVRAGRAGAGEELLVPRLHP